MEIDYQKIQIGWYLLPFNSNLPNVHKDVKLALPSLFELSKMLTSSTLLLTGTSFVVPTQIYEQLNGLRQQLASARNELSMQLRNLSIELHQDFLEIPANPRCVFRIYDNYFKVVRANEMPLPIFIHQTLSISEEVIHDLQRSQIGLEELKTILVGLEKMIQWFCNLVDNAPIEKSLPACSIITSETNATDTSTEDALKRWRTGHLFFNLALMFSADALAQASIKMKNKDHDNLEAIIANATLFFRASTSAMWQASIFSARIYNQVIRPTMEKANKSGFSGHMNREFAHWRTIKDRFRDTIESIGVQKLPIRILDAIKKFENVYLQDGEQHISIAFAMVEDKASLAQEAVTRQYGHVMEKGAVAMLRDILEIRKTEFSFLYD